MTITVVCPTCKGAGGYKLSECPEGCCVSSEQCATCEGSGVYALPCDDCITELAQVTWRCGEQRLNLCYACGYNRANP